MKIRRLLSIGLILIVILSSTGYRNGAFSQDPSFRVQSIATQGPQLAEDAQDAIQVFRETLKISVSSETRVASFNLIENSVRLIYTIAHHAKYNSYLVSQISQRPPEKLFLEFRSFLI